jgi:hypothetical protein
MLGCPTSQQIGEAALFRMMGSLIGASRRLTRTMRQWDRQREMNKWM